MYCKKRTIFGPLVNTLVWNDLKRWFSSLLMTGCFLYISIYLSVYRTLFTGNIKNWLWEFLHHQFISFSRAIFMHYDKCKYMGNVAWSAFHIGSHSRLKILDYKLPSLSNLRCFLYLSPSLALMFLNPNRTKSHVSAFLKCDGNIELHVSATLTFRYQVSVMIPERKCQVMFPLY